MTAKMGFVVIWLSQHRAWGVSSSYLHTLHVSTLLVAKVEEM